MIKETAFKNTFELIQEQIDKIAQKFQSMESITSKTDVDLVNRNILELLDILPGPVTPEKLLRFDQHLYIDWNAVARNEYSIVIDSLLKFIDRDWPGDDSEAEQRLINLFTIDDSYEFCIESITALAASKHLGRYTVLIRILEIMITSDTFLFSMMVDLSYKQQLTDLELASLENRQQRVVQLLVSIPSLVANQLKGKQSDVFMSQQYSGYLLIALLKSIYFIAEANASHKTIIFESSFLAKLFSRIIIDFNISRTSKTIPKTVKLLEIWSDKNEFYSRSIQALFQQLNRNAIEIASYYLLESNKIDKLLGNAATMSSDWRYCFYTKLPLLTYINDDQIVKNLVRYLSTQATNKEDLYNLFIDVLKSWSSKTSLVSQSHDQHLYLTKFILLSANAFNIQQTGDKVVEVCRIIHRGTQNHIESLSDITRAIGMITAEILCKKFSETKLNADDELRFQYDSFSNAIREQVNDLRLLSALSVDEYDSASKPVDESVVLESIYAIVGCSKALTNTKRPMTSSETTKESEIKSTEIVSLSLTKSQLVTSTNTHNLDEDDLDSDDDLEPYNMSNDTSAVLDKSPKYLIDLRDNLYDTDDPDVFQVSVETCEELISRKLPNDDVSIGLELLEMLIGLEKKFYMEHFDRYRLSGCVAICCIFPKECAEYLCREIHSDIGRYSIIKKILMLDILSQTATSLSILTKTIKTEKENSPNGPSMPKKLVELNNEAKRLSETKRIIRERVENKTRRFAKKSSHSFVNAQKNRFSDVAGYFFFPLLYGFGKQQMALSTNCALKHDTDNILLTTFLKTISTVTLASQNCPIASKFGPEIFGLCAVLRFHTEPKIRLGVLHMIASALLAIPKNELLRYCSNDINETLAWLEQILSFNIVNSEKNDECRETAKHVISLCVDILS